MVMVKSWKGVGESLGPAPHPLLSRAPLTSKTYFDLMCCIFVFCSGSRWWVRPPLSTISFISMGWKFDIWRLTLDTWSSKHILVTFQLTMWGFQLVSEDWYCPIFLFLIVHNEKYYLCPVRRTNLPTRSFSLSKSWRRGRGDYCWNWNIWGRT